MRVAAKRLAQPSRQAPRAHGRARDVQYAHKRGLARHALARQDGEMADRAGIQRQEVGRFPQPNGSHVIDGVAERRVHVVEQRPSRADQVVLPDETKAVQRRDIEVPQQLFLCGIERKGPRLGRRDVANLLRERERRALIFGLGNQQFGGTIPRQRIRELYGRGQLLDGELARRPSKDPSARARGRPRRRHSSWRPHPKGHLP